MRSRGKAYRLDRRIAAVFLVTVLAVFVSSVLGILLGERGVQSANFDDAPIVYDYPTQFDRIRWWEGGERGDVEEGVLKWDTKNKKYVSNGGGITKWQSVPDEYGLGHLITDATGSGVLCPKDVYNYGWFVRFDKKNSVCTVMALSKQPYAWIDYYDAAEYMGTLYDYRIYIYGNHNGAALVSPGYGATMAYSAALVNIAPNGTTVYEFHFYPRGTLKELGDLVFVGGGIKPGNKNNDLHNKDNYQSYLKSENCVTKEGQPCMVNGYDNAAWRDAEGNIIYTGVYGHYTTNKHNEKNAAHFEVVYTAKEYEEYLVNAENSLHLPTDSEEKKLGEFKGYLRIDQVAVTGPYVTPLKGVDKVYLEHDTASSGVFEEDNPWPKKQDNMVPRMGNGWRYSWNDDATYPTSWDENGFPTAWSTPSNQTRYGPQLFDRAEICPDYKSSGVICAHRWRTVESLDYDAAHSGKKHSRFPMWVSFSSSHDEPLTLAYNWSQCTWATIKDDTYTVVYVLEDDIEDLPGPLLAKMKEFAEDYKNIYGRDLSEDPVILNRGIDSSRVYKLFKVSKYTDYDVYDINQELKKIEELEDIVEDDFPWYDCEEMSDECLIPYSKEHNSGEETSGDRKYFDGYDLIDEDRVYYGSLENAREMIFPNTCYSDNTSVEDELIKPKALENGEANGN